MRAEQFLPLTWISWWWSQVAVSFNRESGGDLLGSVNYNRSSVWQFKNESALRLILPSLQRLGTMVKWSQDRHGRVWECSSDGIRLNAISRGAWPPDRHILELKLNSSLVLLPLLFCSYSTVEISCEWYTNHKTGIPVLVKGQYLPLQCSNSLLMHCWTVAFYFFLSPYINC